MTREAYGCTEHNLVLAQHISVCANDIGRKQAGFAAPSKFETPKMFSS